MSRSSPTSGDSADSNLTQRVLSQFRSPNSKRTIVDLYEALHPDSLEALQAAIQDLLRTDFLRAIIRVHSPYGTQPGVQDYETVEEIAEYLEDDDFEPPKQFRVGLNNLEVLFHRRSDGGDDQEPAS